MAYWLKAAAWGSLGTLWMAPTRPFGALVDAGFGPAGGAGEADGAGGEAAEAAWAVRHRLARSTLPRIRSFSARVF